MLTDTLLSFFPPLTKFSYSVIGRVRPFLIASSRKPGRAGPLHLLTEFVSGAELNGLLQVMPSRTAPGLSLHAHAQSRVTTDYHSALTATLTN
jgi:hypothetical protein